MKTVLLAVLTLLCYQNTQAQFYSFGRNKVQYEKFEWKVIRTEHFNIYYYDEMEEIAEIGAFYAEEVYDELKVRLNHVVTRKIPLIFYNTSLHFQQTNTTPGFIPDGVGGFFEFIKGRVVIPSTGSLHDFRHVIRHELVHVFMTNKVYRVLTDHRLPADVLPPLWFVEGIAEYLSTEVDAQAEMVIRDAVLNNYLVGLEDMFQIYGTFLMYKEGQNFLEFVEERYGAEKIPQFLENFWMYSDFLKVISYTIGKPIAEIDAEWKFYLKRKYYPLLQDRMPTEFAAKKITDFGFNFSPVYKKIGEDEFIFFVGNRDGYSSLYSMEIPKDGDEPDFDVLVRGEKTEEFETFHLFQSAIDISENNVIAFVTKSGETDALHFYSIEEKDVVETFQQKEIIFISSPKFSDDGNKVVFSAVDRKGFADIYLFDRNTKSLNRLTNDFYDDKDPSFGLSSTEIIFSSDRTSGRNEKKYNLFTYDISNNQIEYLTNINANSYTPIISPKRDYLFFSSDIDSVRNIWRIPIEDGNYGTKAERVTEFITSAFTPSFVDSSKILFTGFEKFSFQIYSDKIPDTASASIDFSFEDISGKWKPGSLSAFSEREDAVYEKEYTLDYAQSQVSTDPIFGTRGGAVFSLSDLFGDDIYNFIIYNTADVQSDFLKSFNVALQRVNLSARANYGYGIFHFSGRRYDIRDSDEFFFERSFGGFFLLNFPLSKFQRLEAQVSVVNSDKQVISGVIERKALLVSNTLSYVADNSLWGPTGPLDGIRARILLGYTGDVKFSNVNYFTFIADYRHYFRIFYSTTFAARAALFYNEGKEARRYFMGGSWDLRGWPRWSIRGEKLWLTSLEFRFPFIDQFYIKFPFFGLGFASIRGAAFFDAGGAWDSKYKQTLGSVGGGVRLNLFGAIVLRYDIGKKIINDFSKFQDGLFYQFFFGWDF